MKSTIFLLSAVTLALAGCTTSDTYQGGTATETGTATGVAASKADAVPGSDFGRSEQWRIPRSLDSLNEPLPPPPPQGSLQQAAPATEGIEE